MNMKLQLSTAYHYSGCLSTGTIKRVMLVHDFYPYLGSTSHSKYSPRPARLFSPSSALFALGCGYTNESGNTSSNGYLPAKQGLSSRCLRGFAKGVGNPYPHYFGNILLPGSSLARLRLSGPSSGCFALGCERTYYVECTPWYSPAKLGFSYVECTPWYSPAKLGFSGYPAKLGFSGLSPGLGTLYHSHSLMWPRCRRRPYSICKRTLCTNNTSGSIPNIVVILLFMNNLKKSFNLIIPNIGRCPHSFFNLIFTQYLLNYDNTKYEKYLQTHNLYEKLLKVPYKDKGISICFDNVPTDPMFSQEEIFQYVKCINRGISKGILIINTKSNGYRYVYDDGEVLGARLGPISGNYWIPFYEFWLIDQGFLDKAGNPKRGAFHSIFKDQFPELIVPDNCLAKDLFKTDYDSVKNASMINIPLSDTIPTILPISFEGRVEDTDLSNQSIFDYIDAAIISKACELDPLCWPYSSEKIRVVLSNMELLIKNANYLRNIIDNTKSKGFLEVSGLRYTSLASSSFFSSFPNNCLFKRDYHTYSPCPWPPRKKASYAIGD